MDTWCQLCGKNMVQHEIEYYSIYQDSSGRSVRQMSLCPACSKQLEDKVDLCFDTRDSIRVIMYHSSGLEDEPEGYYFLHPECAQAINADGVPANLLMSGLEKGGVDVHCCACLKDIRELPG